MYFGQTCTNTLQRKLSSLPAHVTAVAHTMYIQGHRSAIHMCDFSQDAEELFSLLGSVPHMSNIAMKPGGPGTIDQEICSPKQTG